MSTLAPSAAGDAAAEVELNKTGLAAELKAQTEEQAEALLNRKLEKVATEARRKQAGEAVAKAAAAVLPADQQGG